MNCFYTESSHPVKKKIGLLSTLSLKHQLELVFVQLLGEKDPLLVELDIFKLTRMTLSTELNNEATGWSEHKQHSYFSSATFLDTEVLYFIF